MSYLLRDLERPNWLPPSSPEIIKDPDGIPSDAFAVMESVNYMVNPWIFDYYGVPILEEPELIPNIERVPWSDDQRLPQ
jgi:hypothetical protein